MLLQEVWLSLWQRCFPAMVQSVCWHHTPGQEDLLLPLPWDANAVAGNIASITKTKARAAIVFFIVDNLQIIDFTYYTIAALQSLHCKNILIFNPQGKQME